MAAAGPEKASALAEKFFERGNLRVHRETDLFGASAAGVLKNFYAFLIGAAAGAGLGENLQSGIFAAAAGEMAKVLPRFGGQPQTAWGPAGVGDMHATAFSSNSRNREAGENFVKTGKLDPNAESVRTWPILKKRLGGMEYLPLLKLAGAIMEGGASPEDAKKIIDGN
jgi:glycerol-3-phosphate dehydrogenase (NAD(P)+)